MDYIADDAFFVVIVDILYTEVILRRSKGEGFAASWRSGNGGTAAIHIARGVNNASAIILRNSNRPSGGAITGVLEHITHVCHL
jgi:hypothetical protein